MKHYILFALAAILIHQNANAISVQLDCRSQLSCTNGMVLTCMDAPHCPGGQICNCTLPIITCDASNCTDDTTWTTGNTGYVYKKQRACNTNNVCTTTNTLYACAAGYYGTSNSTGTSGCNQCPQHLDSGASSVTRYPRAGTNGTTMADCGFRPSSSSSFSNDKGTYKYTGVCYYSVN